MPDDDTESLRGRVAAAILRVAPTAGAAPRAAADAVLAVWDEELERLRKLTATCICGEPTCESESCDCDAIPCPVNHRAEEAEAEVEQPRAELAEAKAEQQRAALADEVALEHANAVDADVRALVQRAEKAEAGLAEAERRIGHYKAALEATTREVQGLADQLYASCICDPNPQTTEGMLEDCPVHGTDEHRPLALRERAEQAEMDLSEMQTIATERSEACAKAEAERDALNAAIYDTRIAHIRTAHPSRIIGDDCGECRAFVALGLALPSKPDDLDELCRRLAALDAPGGGQ